MYCLTSGDAQSVFVLSHQGCSNRTYMKQLCFLQAHKDLRLTYEAKQRTLGIPVGNICVNPLENAVKILEQDPTPDVDFAPK